MQFITAALIMGCFGMAFNVKYRVIAAIVGLVLCVGLGHTIDFETMCQIEVCDE